MTLADKKTHVPKSREHHVSRNGAPADPNFMKKQGAGRGNWGSYEDDLEEEVHDVAPTSQKTQTKINVVPQE
ncbi:ATPase stabilizing factor 15 kDa protein [Basidiobolus ranarum]|uniref:ATPase stabilizing factor 15 kDa protein n=1 Tax=Basidiobolus ranarum TaxID=34480 RepID=A0ABR2VQL2_9FUNG